MITDKTFVFVTNFDQFRVLERNYPHLLRNGYVVTMDMAVAIELERRGLPFLEIWDYLSRDDIAEAKQSAWHLTNSWFRPFADALMYRGVNLAEIMKGDLLYFFREALCSKIVVSNILSAQRPRYAALFTSLQRPRFWDHGSDVFEAVALWMLESNQVAVTPLASPGQRLSASTDARPIETGQPLEDLSSLFGSVEGCTIMTLAGGVDFENQKRLIEALRHRDRCRVIPVKVGPPPSCLAGAPCIDWSAYYLWPHDLGTLQRDLTRAWSSFKQWQRTYRGPYPEIFANANLDFQFRYFFESLLSGARNMATMGLLLDTFAPQLLITGSDIGGVKRCRVLAAKSRSVPTLQLIHGGAGGYREIYDFLTDHIAVWGETHRRQFIDLGKSPERIIVVGNFNMSHDSPSKTLEGTEDIRDKLRSDASKPKVLFLTSLAQKGMAAPPVNLKTHRQTWRALAKIARKRHNEIFIIKPHPRHDYLDFYRELCSDVAPGHLRLAEGVALLDILPIVDVAVLVNAPTTAAIEAMRHGKPVVYLRNAIHDGIEGYSTPLDEGGTVRVNRIEDFEQTLAQLLDDPGTYQSAVEAGRQFLSDFLYATDGEALENMICLAELLSRTSHSQSTHEPGATVSTAAQDHRCLVPMLVAASFIYYATGAMVEARRAFGRALSTAYADRHFSDYVTEYLSWAVLPQEAERFLDEMSLDLSIETGLIKTLKSKMRAKNHVKAAFEGYQRGDLSQVRRHVPLAILNDPSFLRNRGVLSIGLESLIGKRAMAAMRRIVRGSRPLARDR